MRSQYCTTNRQIYSTPEVASHYAALDYLTACERILFDCYIKRGMAILELGVGGGRTTPYLSKAASRYAGVDYSDAMIRICRSKFPKLDFFVTDASDLSLFADASFDAIVMAFNGLDYVLPEDKRWQCLRECRRVLRVEGILIFSSHNPRAILVRPAWNRERLHIWAQKFVSERSAVFPVLLFVLTLLRSVHASLRAMAGSAMRMIRRLSKSAFWRGEGDLLDPAHGGLVTHYWVPKRVIAELDRFDFQLAKMLGDDYPARSGAFVTDWYYYVFSKVSRSTGEEPCV